MSTLLAAALDYAARGLAVFPCVPGAKEPACRSGFYAATLNPATIRRWWLARRDYNIAIEPGSLPVCGSSTSTVHAGATTAGRAGSRAWPIAVDADLGHEQRLSSVVLLHQPDSVQC